MRIAIFISLSLVALVTACQVEKSVKQEIPKVTLTVSVAASVQDAMTDIKKLLIQENPNLEINYNFGSSGSLQQQIEQGAPADVFISAAPKQMNALQKKGLILTETRRDLLQNKIVLITSKTKGNKVIFQELINDKFKKIALGDPASVPAGQYAKEVLTSFKIYEKLQPKLVFGKDVRQVLTYVETRNVDAGIVYQTDAKISDQIKVTAVAPEDTHSPIVYPVSVLKNTQYSKQAKIFVQFLFSNQAETVFKNYGFTIVDTNN
ncbi:MAG TPA: molybdate ABC transporter substrate-binding protein [Cyanothece sp. UBA12306]|nr:molybdate ABC transporter substrate-binding protein [Cyanothece sp. UBA12306]